MSKVLSSLRYSAEHEWVDGASPVKVGISQIAADALGDVVYVDLPEAGSTVTAGETCGEVESTKSVSDLYAPVTGTVVWMREHRFGAAFDEEIDPKMARSQIVFEDKEAPVYARAAVSAPRHDGWNGKLRRI